MSVCACPCTGKSEKVKGGIRGERRQQMQGIKKPAGVKNREGEEESAWEQTLVLVLAWHKHPSNQAPFKQFNHGPNRLAGKQSAST